MRRCVWAGILKNEKVMAHGGPQEKKSANEMLTDHSPWDVRFKVTAVQTNQYVECSLLEVGRSVGQSMSWDLKNGKQGKQLFSK